MRHLLGIAGLGPPEIEDLLERSRQLARHPETARDALAGRTLLMVFAKPSLRTRLSLDVAMHELGGHAIDYPLERSTVGKKETLPDLMRSAAQYVHLVSARLYADADLHELAAASPVPVVNALTDDEHPLQVLADLLTVDDHVGLGQARLAYLGDASANVARSLVLVAGKLGLHLDVAAPPSLAPPPGLLKRAYALLQEAPRAGAIRIHEDAAEAVAGANVVYTDTWASYHVPEGEADARRELLAPFRVDADLLDQAAPDAVFLHCLPARRGDEVTSDVLDGPRSLVLEQARNRLPTAKAALLWLQEHRGPEALPG